jgi:hypothetical protein
MGPPSPYNYFDALDRNDRRVEMHAYYRHYGLYSYTWNVNMENRRSQLLLDGVWRFNIDRREPAERMAGIRRPILK